MDERTVITIGREFGSGGHEIGQKLAERLGIKCYDKELLELAAKESDKRVERIKKMYDLSESKATDLIQKTDKRRASYYNYYSSKKWGEAKSYDLCLDSGELGIDGSIELILKYIELKEKNLAK